MIIWYKNSFWASVVSIFGFILMFTGISAITEGDVGAGIGCIVVGVAIAIYARKISGDKAFKKWWKQFEDAALVPQMAQSMELAVAVYNKNPDKRTLAKIAEINPAAAQYIREQQAKKK